MSGCEPNHAPGVKPLPRGLEEAAGAVVRSVASAAGVDPARVTRLRSVVEELVREARERPRATDGDDVIVRASSREGRLLVEVADLGEPVSAAPRAG